MKKKLLFINKSQFGYHTDYYKYCEYLRDEYEVSFLCFDTGLEKLEMDNVNVKYISNANHKILRGIRFFIISYFSVLRFNGNIFIHYFPNCHVLKCLIPWEKMILDIRTLSTNRDAAKRRRYDHSIKKATNHFNYTTIISTGLKHKLNLDDSKTFILPLGSDIISNTKKNFDKLNLLYVGNLSPNREIEKTILGLAKFINIKPSIKITYNIVGGEKFQIEKLKTLTRNHNLQDIVHFHGKILHSKLTPIFDRCNIGVSFVPITEWYDFQPPTKTYEYIISGLFTIATNTSSNQEIVNNTNGILINDTPESFTNALNRIIELKESFDSLLIQNTLLDNTWGNIINQQLKPLLSKI